MRAVARSLILTVTALSLSASQAAAESLAERCAANARDGDVEACAQALGQDENNGALRRDYAHALYAAGLYLEAIEQYEELVRRAPESAQAHLDVAGARASLKDYEGAAAPIETAIRLAPDDIMVHRVGAIVFRELDRLEDAFAENLRAAELGDLLAIYEISQLYAEGVGVPRDEGLAFRWLERAAEHGHVFAMRQMAEVYLDGLFGQPADQEKAREWARRAREARWDD